MSMLVVLAAVAAAQQPGQPHQHFPALPVPSGRASSPAEKDKSDLSISATRKVLHDYGACIVQRQHKRAAEAILNNVGNDELLGRYKRLIDGNCLPVPQGKIMSVRFQHDQYRYALADALVRAELAAAPAPQLEGIAPLEHRPAGEQPSNLSPKGKPLKPEAYEAALRSYEEAKAYHFFSRYGECVVRLNPTGARALLLTTPATAEETAQFGALREALGICMPEGATVAFGKAVLRGTIAINYYRLAKAAETSRPVGGSR